MRYYRTTGLIVTQMQELVRRVNEALDKPWRKRTGRPKSLGLYKAVEAACMYLRQNEHYSKPRVGARLRGRGNILKKFHDNAACGN